MGKTPPEPGGSQKHIYEVAKRLSKVHEVFVVTQSGSMCKEFCKCFEFQLPKKLQYLRSFLLLLYSTLYLLFNRQTYDIVHIHENQLFFLIPLAKLSGAKVTATVHGCKGFKFYDNIFLRKIYFYFLGKANTIISVSQQEKVILQNYFKREVLYAPNGADISKFKLTDANLTKNIVFFGRIHQQKGIVYLIDAFAEIQKDFPNFRLVLIGEKNKYAMYLKDYVAKKNIANVVFTGFLDEKSLIGHMINAYVIVLPSLFEGAPLAIIEALASGRPLVTTKISASKILTNNKNALIVSTKNSEQLVDVVEQLIKNPRKADIMGKNGRLLAQQYDWDKIVQRLEEAYYHGK